MARSLEKTTCSDASPPGLGTPKQPDHLMIMHTRAATLDDAPQVLALYRRVSAVVGGIARLENEVSEAYVDEFLSNAISRGIALVAVDESGTILAEIHAYRPGLYCFSHVLSDLTVVVDPTCQGNGIGRRLFNNFLELVLHEHADISRVELVARESNRKAIEFYTSLNFMKEGTYRARVKNPDGNLEADIPMAWIRHRQSSGI